MSEWSSSCGSKRAQRRATVQQLSVHRNPGRDRIALAMAPALGHGFEDRTPKLFELVRWEQVAHDHETVSVERLSKFVRHAGSQPPAAPPGQPVGGRQPPDVKASAIKPPRSEQRIVEEALGARENRKRPPGSTPPRQPTGGPRACDPARVRTDSRSQRMHTGVEGHGSSLEFRKNRQSYPPAMTYPTDDPGLFVRSGATGTNRGRERIRVRPAS